MKTIPSVQDQQKQLLMEISVHATLGNKITRIDLNPDLYKFMLSTLPEDMDLPEGFHENDKVPAGMYTLFVEENHAALTGVPSNRVN